MAKQRKSEWGAAAWIRCDGFVDNLQSADTVKFSLVDVWVCLWVYLLMLHAQPCSTCEVFPVCSIIGASSCTVSCRDHAHLNIQTFAVWLHSAHLWITCLFISVSHSNKFHAFYSILTPAVRISSFFDRAVKQSSTSFHSLRALSSRHPSHSLIC